jgi:hypothetical protein
MTAIRQGEGERVQAPLNWATPAVGRPVRANNVVDDENRLQAYVTRHGSIARSHRPASGDNDGTERAAAAAKTGHGERPYKH